MNDIRKQFRGTLPFPIYVHTSKGPYLLQSDGFQRLEELEARWLFKGQLDPPHVRHRLETDIREFRDQRLAQGDVPGHQGRFRWRSLRCSRRQVFEIRLPVVMRRGVIGQGLDVERTLKSRK